MTQSLEGEIRTLRSLFWSDRDPNGLGFAPLADAYRRAGDVKQALELLGDGMDRHPEFTPGHVVAARLYVEQGLFTEAEIAARRVLDLDPENVDALRSLVRALEEEGEAVEAAKVREQLAILEPDPLEREMPADSSTVEEREVQEDVVEFDPFAPDEPEAVEEEEVFDFGTLAPDEPEVAEEEEVSDFAALAPDEPEALEEEEVLDFAALAPDEPEVAEEEEVLDFAALAPDEPEVAEEEEVLDFAALAPDEPEAVEEEEVFDFATLAPDEPEVAEEEEVLDFAALAPDEPEVAEEEEVLDFATLAPDEPEVAEEEEVLDFATLAPDEPEAVEEEEVLDFATLAPDEPEVAEEEEVLDFAALAPDEPEALEEEEVFDFATLAPDEPEVAEEEEVLDFAALAPDEPEALEEEEVFDFATLAPDEPAPEEPAEQIQTRTMADLYVTQGLIDRAIDLYQHLVDDAPDDAGLQARLEDLRAGDREIDFASGESETHTPHPQAVEQAPEADESDYAEVETLARDLVGSGDAEHEVETPFAWAEEVSEGQAEVVDGPSIGRFFDDLLSYGQASEPEES